MTLERGGGPGKWMDFTRLPDIKPNPSEEVAVGLRCHRNTATQGRVWPPALQGVSQTCLLPNTPVPNPGASWEWEDRVERQVNQILRNIPGVGPRPGGSAGKEVAASVCLGDAAGQQHTQEASFFFP